MNSQALRAETRINNSMAVITLHGDIDGSAEATLQAAYDAAGQQGVGSVLLNFGDVGYINSTGIALIVGLLTAIVVVAINSSQKANRDSNLDGPLVNPATMSAGGTIPVGEADAPVTLEIFLDYMCPSCKQFENANSAQLSQWIEDGAVRVELHPMNFLDSQSQGTMYSTRAANAVAATEMGMDVEDPSSKWVQLGVVSPARRPW